MVDAVVDDLDRALGDAAELRLVVGHDLHGLVHAGQELVALHPLGLVIHRVAPARLGERLAMGLEIAVEHRVAVLLRLLEPLATRIEERHHAEDRRDHLVVREALHQPPRIGDRLHHRGMGLLRHADRVPEVEALDADIERGGDPVFHLLVGIGAAPAEPADLHVVRLRRQVDVDVEIGRDLGHLLQHGRLGQAELLERHRTDDAAVVDRLQVGEQARGGFRVGLQRVDAERGLGLGEGGDLPRQLLRAAVEDGLLLHVHHPLIGPARARAPAAALLAAGVRQHHQIGHVQQVVGLGEHLRPVDRHVVEHVGRVGVTVVDDLPLVLVDHVLHVEAPAHAALELPDEIGQRLQRVVAADDAVDLRVLHHLAGIVGGDDAAEDDEALRVHLLQHPGDLDGALAVGQPVQVDAEGGGVEILEQLLHVERGMLEHQGGQVDDLHVQPALGKEALDRQEAERVHLEDRGDVAALLAGIPAEHEVVPVAEVVDRRCMDQDQVSLDTCHGVAIPRAPDLGEVISLRPRPT